MNTLSSPPCHWLVWDGECGFWFDTVDDKERFTIFPARGCPSPPMAPKLERLSPQTEIVATSNGSVITGGRSVVLALEEAGWRTMSMRIVSKLPLIGVVNPGYRVVARNRNLFSKVMFRG